MLTINSFYFTDKLIESLVLVAVTFLFVKSNSNNFIVLLLLVFISLVGLDFCLGKISYNDIKSGKFILTNNQKPESEAVIETMDDSVAKLYHSQHKLPKTINMEGIYKRQYRLESKPCVQSPKCQNKIKLDPCVRLPTVGQDSLFTDLESYNQDGGTLPVPSVSFEHRYRRNVTGEPTSESTDDTLCQCGSTCQHSAQSSDQLLCSGLKSISSSENEANPAWLFGTFHPHLNQNGQHSFKSAPYCAESPVIECPVKSEPMFCNNLEPTCAVSDLTCLHCDLSEVPLDYAKPLTDRIIRNKFYQECRKKEHKLTYQKEIPCQPKSIIQQHNVTSYPRYVKINRNLAIKNPGFN